MSHRPRPRQGTAPAVQSLALVLSTASTPSTTALSLRHGHQSPLWPRSLVKVSFGTCAALHMLGCAYLVCLVCMARVHASNPEFCLAWNWCTLWPRPVVKASCITLESLYSHPSSRIMAARSRVSPLYTPCTICPRAQFPR